MDEIFSAAENFSSYFNEGMDWKGPHEGMGRKFNWNENMDFYPAYMFPPSNIYMTDDKSLIFEFALAGYTEDNINLEFKGDYMIFSAKVNEEHREEEGNIRFFKRRLKFKDIDDQRYYVPDDKFDRENVKASFKNGILKVIIPPREKVEDGNTIKVDIEGEE